MKLFCPYCGIKGRVKDLSYTRKIVCPGCKKKFIIKCSVIVSPTDEKQLSQHPDIPRKENNSEDIQVSKNTGIEKESLFRPQEQEEQKCSSCKVIIETGKEYRLGNGVYCTDCIPVTMRSTMN